MSRRLFIFPVLIFATVFFSCGEMTEPGISHTTEEQPGPGFYKRLEGQAGGGKVIFQLTYDGDRFPGSYSVYPGISGQVGLLFTGERNDTLFFDEQLPGAGRSASVTEGSRLYLVAEGERYHAYRQSGDRRDTFLLEEIYPPGAYRYKLYSFADSALASPGDAETPKAHAAIAFILPREHSLWLAAEVIKILGFEKQEGTAGLQAAADKWMDVFFQDWKKQLPDAADTSGMPYSLYHFFRIRNVTVAYNDRDFLSVEDFEYNFTGGAHGMYTSTLHSFDLKQEKVLTLPDILTADSASLQKVVEAGFRKQYLPARGSLKEILFENHLSLGQNWGLTDSGLVFLYNPYEVAPYVYGQIRVFISWKEVSSWLTPEFENRLGDL